VTFNSAPFVFFVAWVLVLYLAVARTNRERLWVLAGGSLVFYASFGLRFVPVIVGQALFTHAISRRIHAEPEKSGKRTWLIVTVAGNVALLIAFKYADFLLQSVAQGLAVAGVKLTPPSLDIGRPIGLSFSTLFAIGYAVDVFRGTARPPRLLVFLSGFMFFPHIMSGPIGRAQVFSQFERTVVPSWDGCRRGFLLIGAGLANKTIGDLLGNQAAPVFAAQAHPDALQYWTGSLAFTGQIYADFAGYTDLVSGVACLVGITLPQNFNLPYAAQSPTEFWHRWHMSLSTWLRDYLWLPLTLKYPSRPLMNLITTMVLCGLWHGAAWTYVAWGLFNGVLLIGSHVLAARFPDNAKRVTESLPLRILCTLVTFYLVVLGRVIYRSVSLGKALDALREMHVPRAASLWTWDATAGLSLTVAALVVSHLISYGTLRIPQSSSQRSGVVTWLATGALVTFSFVFATAARGFIYAGF
jgi:D-alanyl-lipoteichoic acid acyltransferase DltB (MBOAT superfamily)